MEGGDIYRAGNSLQVGSSMRWRNSGVEVFSRSSREEDDEAALKWAALQKLPTYNRLRKGILTSPAGEANEVDIPNLGFQERKELIERFLKGAEEDNERFLLKLKNRIDRVGIDLPTIEVRYEHLNVEAEAYVGSRALPTLFNFIVNILEGILNRLHIFSNKKKNLSISTVMTLLLGPPSSGKTTLLLALAGKLDPDLKLSGRVTYNGHEMNEFIPQKTAAYISQHDLHLGEMTVRETLAFSARCQGVGTRYDMLSELCRREKDANIKPDPDIDVFMKAIATEGQEVNVVTDYILKILGLEVCADTIVGDEMLRGISGGQRKRVTTGEMLVGPANALFMDEISTGLDSSTTFQIVNSIKQFIRILNGTVVISLLQPAPETYELFDDIILLSDGQIVYQGSREHVLEFFESMGFKCPERKGIADFLQEVTSRKDQEQYWACKDEPYRFITVKEFNEAFQSFHVGQKIGDELSIPFDKSKNHPAALTTKEYGLKKGELLKACFSREYLLAKRNAFVYIFKLIQLTVVALISMTLFLRTKMPHDSVNDGGIYTEVALWVFTTYYVIGFDPSIERLLRQYILLILVSQMASALFRLIAAAYNIRKWWKWGYWISPMMYSQNAVVVNEFLGKNWRHVLPNSTVSLGVEVLKSPLSYLNPLGKPQAVKSEDSQSNENDGRTERTGILPCNQNSSSERSKTESKGQNRTEVSLQTIHNTKRGMVLPFEPHSITFDEIIYSVDMPQEMKIQGVMEDKLVLLKGVSGAFRPGVLTALMGVSGAGKTTLMDVLAGRKTGGYIEGDVKISGYPKKQETFARISGYCEQNDIHSPHVTVHESLIYSAWLRLPPEVKSETRKMFIEEVMELVELTSLRQALVGLPGVNGLSTEQRKRLTIAVELVANPSIIFMDEPTSGLDARAAAIVMRTVRNTVDTGRTVVCTIHQPSIDIFEAFDELLLLKHGGQEIYVGPLGRHSCHLIKYFEGIEGISKIKDGYNPATWMLEVTTSAQELDLKIDFAQFYKTSELYRRNKQLIKDFSTPAPSSKDLYFPTQYTQSFLIQTIACLWKQHWSYWRNPLYTAVKFLFTIVIALMFGTIFWKLGSKTKRQQDLFNAMGSMYTAVLFLGVQNATSVQPVVAVERTVFYREKAAGMYSACHMHLHRF
ncbi:pleiotropic drug resistance protein 1 [Prunus yedoensis var. nudiflora]|uniref:Pleiotropic drug resistance protein 1 n=1 Tax=Prunus yedoensis var. nudiflora TaxID=2094558 RepID=A0A314ZIF5_PRUYE|nr:pleiotropic drug resistance protein 1 [Prunus yedoensis var. nudiflora]